MDQVEISCILTGHAEEPQWVKRAIKSVATQVDAPPFEIIVIADKATTEVVDAAYAAIDGHKNAEVHRVDYGDLGLSRNHGFGLARGRYCVTLDLDDLHGCLWFKQAYDYALKLREERKAAGLDPEAFALHQEYMLMFGADKFLHKCYGDDAPEFDAKDLMQWNAFAASCFAPRETFLKYPYRKAEGGHGYEDFQFHVETFGAGVSHRCPPGSVYAVRLKGGPASMAYRYVQENKTIPAFPLYDRRDLPDAKLAPTQQEWVQLQQDRKMTMPAEIHQQAKVMHYEIGEFEVSLNPEMPIRSYPRQSYFWDQGDLRDKIGTAKHVILVRELVQGGAEKYALDWASALKEQGKDAVIIETEPNRSPWVKRAEDAGIRVIRWQPRAELIPKEVSDTLRRALIQAQLDSVFVCNSPVGWTLIHENAQVLARNVLGASFAPIPFGHGFSSCPPFYVKNPPPNLTIITDNATHRDRLSEFNPELQIALVYPRCKYSGPSKLSRIEKDRRRILWAGRGTMEKGPGILPAIAGAIEGWADLHVWGEVAPMNGPESLKYRGPFDGFDKIDGSYDCYLNTSIFEGCPNVAMEAALADLPIVGPKQGALPQLATVTYDKKDPLTIASALSAAIDKGHTKRTEVKDMITAWAQDFGVAVSALVSK